MGTEAAQIVQRYSAATAELEEAAIARLKAALYASFQSVQSSIKAKYPALMAGDSLLVTSGAVLRLEQLKATLDLGSPQNAPVLEAQMENVLKMASASGQKLRSELLATSLPTGLKTADIAIEAAAFAAKDSVACLSKHSAQFREMATATVTQGILQGWGTSQVALQIRSQFGMTLAKAEMIARTEILSASNSAAKATYRANGIEYGQIIATGDRRICGLCSSRNLRVYRLEEASAPFHPNCRCFVMPYSPQWREDGLIDEDWERSFYKEGEPSKIDSGLSPFEKASGMDSAPEVIWSVVG